MLSTLEEVCRPSFLRSVLQLIPFLSPFSSSQSLVRRTRSHPTAQAGRARPGRLRCPSIAELGWQIHAYLSLGGGSVLGLKEHVRRDQISKGSPFGVHQDRVLGDDGNPDACILR